MYHYWKDVVTSQANKATLLAGKTTGAWEVFQSVRQILRKQMVPDDMFDSKIYLTCCFRETNENGRLLDCDSTFLNHRTLSSVSHPFDLHSIPVPLAALLVPSRCSVISRTWAEKRSLRALHYFFGFEMTTLTRSGDPRVGCKTQFFTFLPKNCGRLQWLFATWDTLWKICLES